MISHLTQKDGNTNRRFLNTALRNDFLARAPTDAYNICENVTNNLQDELLAALNSIHKFVH
jgi:hypothetical protein